MSRFPLGRVYATPGALQAMADTLTPPVLLIGRHVSLDPGELGAQDQLANLRALRDGARILSAYQLEDGTRIWVITEADRSTTTILLPEEY